MRTFECRHDMIVNEDRFWEIVHHSTDFIKALYTDYLDFKYEVLEDDRETGIRRTYITPKVDAPRAIVAVLGDSVSFTESGKFEQRDSGPYYSFEVVPNKFADKIKIKGAMITHARTDSSCERVVEFEVTCKIFGIGKLLEGFIQKEVMRSYAETAVITNDYLKKLQ